MLNLATFFGLLLCAAAFYGTGRRVLAWCRLDFDDPLADWVLSTTAGLIIVSNLVMLAGFIGLLYKTTFWIILLALILLNIAPILKFIRRAFSRDAWMGWTAFSLWEKLLLIVMGIYLAIRLFNTFAPPITWDATTHHYLVPSMYLKAHRIYDFPHVIFSYYPSLIEMLYLFGMGLVKDLLSSHIGWMFGPLAAAAIYAFGAKFFTKRVGLIASAIFLSLGGIGVQMDGGYVDLPQALFSILCLYKLLEWRESRRARDFILAALLFSANLATKHLGYAFLPPVLVYIAIVVIREHRTGIPSLVKHIFAFVLLMLILPLAWYIRAYILTGNPFFPFPVFGFPTLRYPPLELSTWVNPGFKKNIATLISYLWFLTTDMGVEGALGKRFTPYFLAMLPFFWLAFRKGTYASSVLFWFCLYFMGFVFYSSPVKTRYMLFFMPFMSLLAADILNKLLLLPGKSFSFRKQLNERFEWRMLVSFITIILIFIPLLTTVFQTTSFIREHTFKVIVGMWKPVDYRLRESPRNWSAIEWMNENLPEDSLILAVEARMYGLDRDWITWLGLEDEPIPQTPADNVRLWKKYGFTHLWIGDDATTKTLMYYNILNLPGDEDEVVFHLQDLWYDFFGRRFSNSVVNEHLKKYWMPRELAYNGYELYENGERVTDLSGNPLYKARRSDILNDPLKMAQINFVDSIRELVRTGGLHIVYPPPDWPKKEELTFVLKTDYETYRLEHEEVRAVGD